MTRLLCLIPWLLVAARPAFAGPVKVEPKRFFSVGIEQGGVAVPIKDNKVQLQRKPFTIVIRFAKPDFVFVNASFGPASFEAAASGKPISRIDGFQETGMAEDDFNPDKELFITDTAPHYWHYESERDHRFNRVLVKPGLIVCRRDVASFWMRDADPTTAIKVEDSTAKALYLIFARIRVSNREAPDEDRVQWDEDQRECLKVEFTEEQGFRR